MQNGQEISFSNHVELNLETARNDGGNASSTKQTRNVGGHLKRQPPMFGTKYRCPLTRYKSIRLPFQCQCIEFETPEEAISHIDVHHQVNNICTLCRAAGGEAALVCVFDKPSSLKAHILSLEHKEQLEGARLYAEVQISPSTKLGWIAQRVQAQCTIQLPDTDTNGVDRNAIVQVPHYSSPQNLEQSLVETTFKDELLGEDIRQLIESTDNSIWESLAGGSDVSH